MFSLSSSVVTASKKVSGFLVRLSVLEPAAFNYNFGGIQSNNSWRWKKMSTSGSDSGELTVHHDPKNRKFYIKLGESEARLEYLDEVSNGTNVLDMWHTEVPPPLQGKGIAKILAKAAFEHVVQNNMKMRLSCSYLQKYFKDNPLPKYKNAVVQ